MVGVTHSSENRLRLVQLFFVGQSPGSFSGSRRGPRGWKSTGALGACGDPRSDPGPATCLQAGSREGCGMSSSLAGQGRDRAGSQTSYLTRLHAEPGLPLWAATWPSAPPVLLRLEGFSQAAQP